MSPTILMPSILDTSELCDQVSVEIHILVVFVLIISSKRVFTSSALRISNTTWALDEMICWLTCLIYFNECAEFSLKGSIPW